jgi:competence protein ComEA
MPEISRSQVAVYGAVAIAVLLIGVRAIRAEGESGGQGGAASWGSGQSSGGGSFDLASEGSGDIVVDVAGAVVDPGVYRLPSGARVVDAVRRAGGPLRSALLGAVNRAARLADGQQVVIPERVPAGAGPTAAGASAAAAPGAADQGPISLGTATAEQLETIEGIGPVTASDIIEFRDQHGGLASVEQLNQVSGIGPTTMEALRDGLQP